MFRKNCVTLLLLFIYSIGVQGFADEIREIKKGETVYQLAKEYGIPVEVLLQSNNINHPSEIPIGKKITIPTDESAHVYIVKKGDTLYSIAHQYGLNLYTLRSYNKLISDNIYVGQKIIISPEISPQKTKKLNNIQQQIYAKKRNTQTKNTQKQSTNINSFGSFDASDFNKNAKSIGQLSDAWPIKGEAYLLNGKLPGVLIEGKEGSVVKAAKSGVVVYSALHTSFSNVLVVQGDDNYIYVYAGQKSLFVSQGDKISQGDDIGVLGLMPTLQKPILYFSLWNKDTPIDPRKMINAN